MLCMFIVLTSRAHQRRLCFADLFWSGHLNNHTSGILTSIVVVSDCVCLEFSSQRILYEDLQVVFV